MTKACCWHLLRFKKSTVTAVTAADPLAAGGRTVLKNALRYLQTNTQLDNDVTGLYILWLTV